MHWDEGRPPHKGILWPKVLIFQGANPIFDVGSLSKLICFIYLYSGICTVIFKGKQNIPWDQVEGYLKQYISKSYIVEEYQDLISIAADFPDEYAESVYTKKLRGALAKVKANAAQIIGSLIIHATNKRWMENKAEKHKQNAAEGWIRYDTYFSMPVQGSEESGGRVNKYVATLIVRKTPNGMFLYDVINIKKEASTPLGS